MNLKLSIRSKILIVILSLILLSLASILYVILFSKNTRILNYELQPKQIIKIITASAVLLSSMAALAAIVIRFITDPLLSIKNNLLLLEKGILPRAFNKITDDEIGEIAQKLNTYIQSLKKTALFAQSIGDGNFDDNYKPLSNEDTLGNALINMHNSLKISDKKEKERVAIMNAVAEIGEIVRRHASLDSLSEEITKYLTQKINAVQGAFYIVSKEENIEQVIELKYSYAYNRTKFLKGTFKFGEGLIGQSAIEMSTIIRTEIPKDYCTISSGILGDQKPKAILIVPLITEEEVFGLIEFSSLHIFEENEIRLIEATGPIIARTIFNIHISERTHRHLRQSQQMSLELKEQQEELHKNAKKMQMTQEELKIINHKLEEQIEEVNRTQKRMQLLLENASEVIIIYEADEKIRYISPSVTNILGYSPNELIEHKLENYLYEEDMYISKEMFNLLHRSPEKSITIQHRFYTKDKQCIWVEAYGKNLLSDPAVNGIVINYRDITLKRKAEIEEHMRKNMQALSENSPDLITRLSSEGQIAYTNPIIETYSGHKAEYFLNKSLTSQEVKNSITTVWNDILQKVKSENQKLSLELNYDSPIGKRIMQVNAIPEFNENKMESVLIVSHDITERKIIELDIQAKNKSINESINYSKRIQNAIIPDTRLIQKSLPESFILYMPRDVVSGDFPWFSSKGDDLFIAAVDCTGHGVPGAMLSLVGYFQLNTIAETKNSCSASELLDTLDHEVNSTLIKDTQEENIKDGMDIALCKINTKEKTIEYAGAHRPLYLLRKETIEEFKGDKWAIGGGIYKNQTKFTNHKFNYKKGDSIYFFSDGLPDQFGGPQNRKFGSNRIREIILSNQNKSMDEQEISFRTEIEKWKGKGKQTDDILLIGIKF